MIFFLIIFCEVMFWVLVAAGLTMRYAYDKKSLGMTLLALTPLVDLALLIMTVLDLRGGATPTVAHGLAAVYIGVSIAFGRKMIAWADGRFAAKLGGAAKERPPKKYGKAHAAQERRDWLRHLLAFGIGAALLLAMIALIGDMGQSQVLLGLIRTWAIVLGIDFLVSFSYTLFPREEKE